jgi:hypothetical protein
LLCATTVEENESINTSKKRENTFFILNFFRDFGNPQSAAAKKMPLTLPTPALTFYSVSYKVKHLRVIAPLLYAAIDGSADA